MKLREYHEKLRPFVFHGVYVDNDPKEAQGDCPFCLKEGHFGVDTPTGKWRCVRCDAQGNIYTFLKLLYELSLENLNPDLLKPLAEDRGLKVPTLVAVGIVPKDPYYVVPSYGIKGALTNLSKIVWSTKENKWNIMSTPGCAQWPFGMNLLTKHGPLWVMEGLWDFLKMREVLSTTTILDGKYRLSLPKRSLIHQCDVIGVPGCNGFNPKWLELLEDRDVNIVYDSDHPKENGHGTFTPGYDGMQKVLGLIHEQGKYPTSVRCIHWGDNGYDATLPDGYDARDLFKEHGHCKGLAHLDSLMRVVDLNPPQDSYKVVEPVRPAVELVDCHDFNTVVEEYRKRLRVRQSFKDTLATMFAVNLSVTVPGDQLWFRIIGPPGSGKSTMAMAFGGSETVRLLSKFTGFHSGYVGDNKERKKGDSSLIPQLNGKMVICKDADTILSSPQRDSILGESRELYDGESEAIYRNRKTASYFGHRMSFVWCGTDVLRGLNRTPLGERFLDCDIFSDKDQHPYLQSAYENTLREAGGYLSGTQSTQPLSIADSLKGITAGFIRHLWDNIGSYPAITFPKESQEALEAMGQLLSYIRTTIDRVGHDMAYRPRRELGTRLVAQYTKLATCLACVLNHPVIDEEIIRILRKITFDTARNFRTEIITQLYANKNGHTAQVLERKLGLPITTIRHHLRDMLELGIISRVQEPNRSGIRGRNLHVVKLKGDIHKYYRLAVAGKQ